MTTHRGLRVFADRGTATVPEDALAT